MSSLAERKSRLRVEFSEQVRERGRLRAVTMELQPWCLRVRLKGMRQSFEISPAAIYSTAVKMQVEHARAERKAARKKARP